MSPPSARLRPSPSRPDLAPLRCDGCTVHERLEAVEAQLTLLVTLTQEHLRTHAPRRWSRSMPAPPKSDPPRPGQVELAAGDKRWRSGPVVALLAVAIVGGCGVAAVVGKEVAARPAGGCYERGTAEVG